MPSTPETISNPKVQEFMSHYYAMSNDKEDHGGFSDMFTADGEYSINNTKAKGPNSTHMLCLAADADGYTERRNQ